MVLLVRTRTANLCAISATSRLRRRGIGTGISERRVLVGLLPGGSVKGLDGGRGVEALGCCGGAERVA